MKVSAYQIRLLSLILCIALLVAAMAGCGSNSNTTSSAEASETTAQTQESSATPSAEASSPTEAASQAESDAEILPSEQAVENPGEFQLPICEETTTISYFFEMSPMVAGYLETMNDNITYQLLEDLTNVHIDFWAVSDETEQQFNLMVASGEYADIMVWGSRYYTGGAIKGVQDEVFMELTGVIEEYMPNYAARISDPDIYGQVIMSDGNIGEIFTLNRNPVVPGSGPIVRKDWLEQLGMAPEEIVTYEDYHEMLLAFKNEFGATSALYLGPNGVPSGNYLTAGYGIAAYTDSTSATGAYYQEDGTVKYGPIQPAFREYLTMIHQWYEEGLISSDYLSNSDVQISAGDVTDGSTGLWYHMSQIMEEHMNSAIDEGFESAAIQDAVMEEGTRNRLGNYTGSTVESNSLPPVKT